MLRWLLASLACAATAFAREPPTPAMAARGFEARVYPTALLGARLPPPPPPPLQFSPMFGPMFGDNMVLQRGPAQAAVYGTVTNLSTGGRIVVAVVGAGQSYSVTAAVTGQSWKALLKPAPAGGSVSITATASPSPSGLAASITNVTFGDVWYCGGQSNMALPLAHTVSRNTSIAAIAAGRCVRLF